MHHQTNTELCMLSLHHIDGKFQFISPEATSLLGYSPGELLHQCCYNYFHPDDIKEIENNHQTVIEGEAKHISYRFRMKNGDYRLVTTIAYTIREPDSSFPHQIICLTYPAPAEN